MPTRLVRLTTQVCNKHLLECMAVEPSAQMTLHRCVRGEVIMGMLPGGEDRRTDCLCFCVKGRAMLCRQQAPAEPAPKQKVGGRTSHRARVRVKS